MERYDGFNSIGMDDVLNKNNNIDDKDYIIKFLYFLDRIIPKQHKDNFYKNVEGLKIEVKDKYDDINNKGFTPASYNIKDNVLRIYKDGLKKLWEISLKEDNPEEYYWNQLNMTILHELTHMSSSKYDKENNVAYSGYDKISEDNYEVTNRGLNEGMTEFIAFQGIGAASENLSGYYIEMVLIMQLILIIGQETMLDSYYGNKGTKELEKSLNKYCSDPVVSYNLFREIEMNFQSNNNFCLGIIEDKLINFYQGKMINSICNDMMNEEEARKSLIAFESFINILKKFVFDNKKVDNYDEFEKTINSFNDVKENINNLLLEKYSSNNIGHK